MWTREQGLVRLRKRGRKRRECHGHPGVSSANFKVYFCAPVLDPDTNKTQGVLSEDQVPPPTWLESAFGGKTMQAQGLQAVCFLRCFFFWPLPCRVGRKAGQNQWASTCWEAERVGSLISSVISSILSDGDRAGLWELGSTLLPPPSVQVVPPLVTGSNCVSISVYFLPLFRVQDQSYIPDLLFESS